MGPAHSYGTETLLHPSAAFVLKLAGTELHERYNWTNTYVKNAVANTRITASPTPWPQYPGV